MTGLSTHQVSKLLNFFVTTLPRSIPRRSTIRWAKSGCEVPENTLMFGILEWIKFRQPACFSKLSRIKLLARIGLAERTTGITQSTSRSFYYKFFSPKRGQRRRRLIGVCSRSVRSLSKRAPRCASRSFSRSPSLWRKATPISIADHVIFYVVFLQGTEKLSMSISVF